MSKRLDHSHVWLWIAIAVLFLTRGDPMILHLIMDAMMASVAGP